MNICQRFLQYSEYRRFNVGGQPWYFGYLQRDLDSASSFKALHIPPNSGGKTNLIQERRM
jgi:hypothetical protein